MSDDLAADLLSSLRLHRAQTRQRTLDRLRTAARTSESAAKLLAQIDPSGELRYIDSQGRPVDRADNKYSVKLDRDSE